MILAAVIVNAFLAAFGGTWNCAAPGTGPAVRWTIEPAPRGSWAQLTTSGHDGGVGYVGYLPYERAWRYESFHNDGSVASHRSPGPEHGLWTWSGSYTNARRIEHAALQWRREDDVIVRRIGRLIGTSFRATSQQVCRRT